MLAITGIVLVSAVTVTEAPLSQNVSVGQLGDFTCATTNSQDIIIWSTNPNVIATNVVIQSIPDGGKQSVLSFTALLEHNKHYCEMYCHRSNYNNRGCACDVTNRSHVMHTVILSVNCKKQRALFSFVSCTAQ